MAVTREALIQFLNVELDVDMDGVDDETLLFSSGMIDSFALVDLIAFLEDQGGFRVNPTDVSLDNLDSIDCILSFLKKRGAA